MAKKVTIIITNSNGTVLQTQNEYAGAGQKIIVNTSSLTAGNYFLVIESGDGAKYAKPFQKM